MEGKVATFRPKYCVLCGVDLPARPSEHKPTCPYHEQSDAEELRRLRRLEEEVEEIEQAERVELKELKQIVRALRPRLGHIKIAFTRGDTMAQGPVILNENQTTIASVLYFDTTGAPMPSDFVPPAVTYTIDHPEFASSAPRPDGQLDDVDYVSAGVANLTATVTSAEGAALSDTETVTCVPTVPPPPKLGSIKIDFSTPGDIPPPAPPAAPAVSARGTK